MEDYRSGISLCGLLFLVFLTLKLCGVITWSWWYVTMPLWFGWAIIGLVIIYIAVMVCLDVMERK